jgi:RNA polymerase sigma-70 factor (ECF subfamily)
MGEGAPTPQEAFDALYLGTRDHLAAQIHALTGDRVEARDLVQEAFVRCWDRWERVSGYDDPEAWVRRVAYNLAKSGWRRKRRARRLTAIATPGTGPGADPSDPAETADLLAALRSLPEHQRTAVVLHYLGDRSVDEVAAEMGVPSGTVKSWLSRGRDRLAAEIDPDRTEEASHG